MGVISETYAMKLLYDFLKTDAGKAKISQAHKEMIEKGFGIMTSKEMAVEIIHNICEEVRKAVREVIRSFYVSSIQAVISDIDSQGILRASISVDEDALRRASLHHMNSDLTISHGQGINDIIALFTHGYSLNKRPYGFWVRNGGDSMARIGARMHRDPNPFLQNLVNKLNAEYDGRCVVTLNNKYKAQGGG